MSQTGLRWLRPGIGTALALLMLAGQAATPAMAAMHTVHCVAGDHATIQDAVSVAPPGGTVRVCAGTYEEYVNITQNGLKLLARGAVTIQPPPVPSPANDAIVTVSNASNVTVSGFIIDGADLYGTTAVKIAGIMFDESSGTASHNTVKRLRRTPLDGNPFGGGITAGNSSSTPLKVRIVKNTIQDFQVSGISVIGPFKVSISDNLITASGEADNHPVGIRLVRVADGVVSKNDISFDWNNWNSHESAGILVDGSSHVSLMGNHIDAGYYGIRVTDTCPAHTSNANVIKGNRLRGNAYGVVLFADNACASTVTNNKIMGNRIFDYHSFPGYAVWISTAGAPAVTTGNQITKNIIGGYQAAANPIQDDSASAMIVGNRLLPAPPPGAP